jgi:microcin C transport system substrate-binding protein
MKMPESGAAGRKPDHIPDFNIGFLTVWWYDKDKAAKTGAAQ